MEQHLVDLSIDYHGSVLVDELVVEQVAVKLPNFLSLLETGENHDQPRDEDFEQKLAGFIARKSDIVFRPSEGKIPLMNLDVEDQDRCAVMPPLESFMDVPAVHRRQHFYKSVARGDLVIAVITSVQETGLGMSLLCLDGGNVADINDLELPAFCPVREIPRNYSYETALEGHNIKDKVRAVVLHVPGVGDKVVLSLQTRILRPKHDHIKLGVISDEELPLHYRNLQDLGGRTFVDYLERTPGFANPCNVAFLSTALGLKPEATYSLMRGLQTSVSKEEFSEELRKSQSFRWALRSVAEGIHHFKQGRHVEAMQHLNRALEIDVENVEAFVARGALYANNESYARALEDFSMALKLNPEHGNARKYTCETLMAQGRSYLEEGKHPDSIACFDKVLELDPSCEAAQHILQKIHALAAKADECENTKSELIDLSPERDSDKQGTFYKTQETLRRMIKDDKAQKSQRKKKRRSSFSVEEQRNPSPEHVAKTTETKESVTRRSVTEPWNDRPPKVSESPPADYRQDLKHSRDQSGEKEQFRESSRESYENVHKRSRERKSEAKRESLDPKRENNELRRESLEPRRESLEPRRESFEHKRENIEPRRESLDPRRESLDPRRESLDPRRESLEHKRENIEPRRESLDPRRESLEPRRESLDPRRESLDPRRESLERKRENIDPRRESLEPRRESLDPRRESLEPRRESLAPRKESVEPRRENLEKMLYTLESLPVGVKPVSPPPEKYLKSMGFVRTFVETKETKQTKVSIKQEAEVKKAKEKTPFKGAESPKEKRKIKITPIKSGMETPQERRSVKVSGKIKRRSSRSASPSPQRPSDAEKRQIRVQPKNIKDEIENKIKELPVNLTKEQIACLKSINFEALTSTFEDSDEKAAEVKTVKVTPLASQSKSETKLTRQHLHSRSRSPSKSSGSSSRSSSSSRSRSRSGSPRRRRARRTFSRSRSRSFHRSRSRRRYSSRSYSRSRSWTRSRSRSRPRGAKMSELLGEGYISTEKAKELLKPFLEKTRPKSYHRSRSRSSRSRSRSSRSRSYSSRSRSRSPRYRHRSRSRSPPYRKGYGRGYRGRYHRGRGNFRGRSRPFRSGYRGYPGRGRGNPDRGSSNPGRGRNVLAQSEHSPTGGAKAVLSRDEYFRQKYENFDRGLYGLRLPPGEEQELSSEGNFKPRHDDSKRERPKSGEEKSGEIPVSSQKAVVSPPISNVNAPVSSDKQERPVAVEKEKDPKETESIKISITKGTEGRTIKNTQGSGDSFMPRQLLIQKASKAPPFKDAQSSSSDGDEGGDKKAKNKKHKSKGKKKKKKGDKKKSPSESPENSQAKAASKWDSPEPDLSGAAQSVSKNRWDSPHIPADALAMMAKRKRNGNDSLEDMEKFLKYLKTTKKTDTTPQK